MRRASELYGRTPRQFKSESADCAVRALGIASGIGYEAAHAKMAAEGRFPARRTAWGVITRACLSAGGIPVTIDLRMKPTLAHFIRTHRVGRFHLSRAGHSFALVDGVVHDWKGGKTGPRSRIRRAYQFPVTEVKS